MTRKPFFWIALVVLGLAGSATAIRLFPVAFPILSVHIDMDREGALKEASELATRMRWDPPDFRQAASFGQLDPAFQTYMELEGGGLEELNRLTREGILTLYAWRVRHFAEETVEESEIRFTPGGAPLGFRLKLSEEASGTNLGPEEARALAVAEAAEHWGFEASRFDLLETSQEEHTGGRIDHVFVFQRHDLALGEARIRHRLRVGGDRLVESTPFLHVPEGFLRRYQDTRDTNESIAFAGTVVFLLLFMVMAGGMGTVHLLRKRWIEWKAPLAWGGVVAGLMAMDQVNSLPLTWMGYDTALPAQLHVATALLSAGLIFLAGTVFLALLFLAGEGLLRLGFPDQIQQWKMWTPGVANSDAALGRTLAPYLVLGLKLGFVVVFYLVTSRVLGWWSPASALVEPDLLATHLPWLTAVSTSLFAALSEETVFRAIPIGAAALMGRRYGRPGLWIWGAVVLQALVFGASHANYPQQPAFARVVEIFPTYFVWGVICVYFGLIPSIIAHYAYDLVLFSLPLFAAETEGIWLDRSAVVLAGILPLAVVLVSRLRLGRAVSVPAWALNGAWRPSEKPPKGPGPRDSEQTARRLEKPIESPPPLNAISPWGITAVLTAAVAGVVTWIPGVDSGGSFGVHMGRGEAVEAARTALAGRGVGLGPDWMPLTSIRTGRSLSHQFVWENGTEDDYHELLGGYLDVPAWEVRFVRFQVDPEERAESFIVSVIGDESPPAVRHRLPEGREGASLSETEARALALGSLPANPEMAPGLFREISAQETARPNRKDWTFTFADTQTYPLQEGEARLEVEVAGDQVAGVRRFVHLPEDWERDWRADASKRNLVEIVAGSLLLLMILALAILGTVLWTRGSLVTQPLQLLAGSMGVLLATGAVNEWPGTVGTFTTQLSFGNQAAFVLLGSILALATMAVGTGILGALGHTWMPRPPHKVRGAPLLGIAVGISYVGFTHALGRIGPPSPPSWPTFGGAVSYLPWLSVLSGALVQFLALGAGAFVMTGGFQRLREGGRGWAILPPALLLGIVLAPVPGGGGWLLYAVNALAVSAALVSFWLLCRKWGWDLIPGAVGGVVVMSLLGSIPTQPFAGHTLGAVLGLAGVLMAIRTWARTL